MMALLMESVPSFEETWIEGLGDLARYRMAIEEADLRDREVWSGVARMWYNKASDKSPNVGRIQHHLAVLARPNIVQQLFYYSKALVSVIQFQKARESVMFLFKRFLEGSETDSQRYPAVESTFVKANGVLFTHGSIADYDSLMSQFASGLDSHIGRVADKFRVQGAEIAFILCAATLGFGNLRGAAFDGRLWFKLTATEVFRRIGDKNIIPFMHVVLAYLFGLTDDAIAAAFMERFIPRKSIVACLNTIDRSDIVNARFEGAEFPQHLMGMHGQLPEDFILRGSIWGQRYFPTGFFEGQEVDEKERALELPIHAALRAERCLWLGVRLGLVSINILCHRPFIRLTIFI
jgi:Est1 DNA/RNA binding domain